MKKPIFEKWKPEEKTKLLFDLLADLQDEERKLFEKENIEPVALKDSLDQLDKLKDKRTLYRWPFPKLQEALLGYWPGEMYVVGGTTGMGKSLIAAYLTLRFVIDGGKALYFSTEMPHTEITRRLWRMWGDFLGDRDNFTRLHVDYTDTKFAITPALIDQMLLKNAEAVEAGMDKKYDLVVVDNLHWFMRGGDSVSEDIGMVTKAMKELAMKHQCSVILVSHVNRGANYAHDTTPDMNYLKGSSYIEQDSDAVMMITRKGRKNEEDGTVELTNISLFSLEKNRRNGTTFKDLKLMVNDNLTFTQLDA